MNTVFIMTWQHFEEGFGRQMICTAYANEQLAMNAMNETFEAACEARDIENWERCDVMCRAFRDGVCTEEWAVTEVVVQS